MKVLLDPIYSSQPSRCSSASKFKKLAERLLASREDLFIYWRWPSWADEADEAWRPQSPRVRYMPCHYFHRDRVREYQVFPFELEDHVGFDGECWDYDVLFTMRTAQVPTMRACMNSSRHTNATWQKSVLLLEEMAITSFRRTVPQSDAYAQDILTYAGYLTADRTYITAGHVRKGILNGVREYYSPTQVRRLGERISLVNPMILDTWEAKDPKFRHIPGKTVFRPFFAGRLNAASSRADGALQSLDRHWIWHGDQVAPGGSSQSEISKVPIPDIVDLRMNGRDEFWRVMREEAHVNVYNAADAEFSGVVIEPLCLGVPVICADAEWSRSLLGDDYPFFHKGEQQMYAWLSMFQDEYPRLYDQFIHWRDDVFRKRMSAGGVYGCNLYDQVLADMDAADAARIAKVREQWPRRVKGELMVDLLAAIKSKSEIHLLDEIKGISSPSKFAPIHAKLKDPEHFRLTKAMPFHSAWNEQRLLLQVFDGWQDAGTGLGHMRRA